MNPTDEAHLDDDIGPDMYDVLDDNERLDAENQRLRRENEELHARVDHLKEVIEEWREEVRVLTRKAAEERREMINEVAWLGGDW